MDIYQLLKKKKIRLLRDKDTGKVWFSATDMVAALLNTNHETARNYFKQLKYRKNWLIKQVKMTAKDGKIRFTNALDQRDIKRLVVMLSKVQTSQAFLVCQEKIMEATHWVRGLPAGVHVATIATTTVKAFDIVQGISLPLSG